MTLDKYTIGTKLGEGGYGEVFKCKPKGNDRTLAVKTALLSRENPNYSVGIK